MIDALRGDIVTIADRTGDYTGKPRPAVILQSNDFPHTGSVVVCLLTTREEDAPLLRLRVEPSPLLPLQAASWIMVDKVTAVMRAKIGVRIGRIAAEDMARLERAIVVFLGIG